MEGNARVNTETLKIEADKIELSGKNFKIITATGSVKGSNSKTKMEWTCQKLTYNRDTKIAILENMVHLIDSENSVTADAEIIEYDEQKKTAIMQISVNLVQKDNTCTAAYAVYNQESQMLKMRGNPRVTQGKDVFRAQEIELNLKTEEITLSGRVQGSVTTEEKKEEQKQDKKEPENTTPKEEKK